MIAVIHCKLGIPNRVTMFHTWDAAYSYATQMALRVLPTLQRTMDLKVSIVRELEETQSISTDQWSLTVLKCN